MLAAVMDELGDAAEEFTVGGSKQKFNPVSGLAAFFDDPGVGNEFGESVGAEGGFDVSAPSSESDQAAFNEIERSQVDKGLLGVVDLDRDKAEDEVTAFNESFFGQTLGRLGITKSVNEETGEIETSISVNVPGVAVGVVNPALGFVVGQLGKEFNFGNVEFNLSQFEFENQFTPLSEEDEGFVEETNATLEAALAGAIGIDNSLDPTGFGAPGDAGPGGETPHDLGIIPGQHLPAEEEEEGEKEEDSDLIADFFLGIEPLHVPQLASAHKSQVDFRANRGGLSRGNI
jgi:hypothetical protein